MARLVPTWGQRSQRLKKNASAWSDNQELQINHHIRRCLVKLIPLPIPDFWQFPLPEFHTCLLTDDGSLTTNRLAKLLSEGGWRVVVLSFPKSIVMERPPLPQGVNRIVLADFSEQHLQQQLAIILETYGLIGAFIHLDPEHQLCDSKSQKSILKSVFLLAKHLKRSLNQVAQTGRSCFITVARLDGEFGLGATIDFSATSGGLFGLTKTLNLEWEGVFCRAIDLSPKLNAEASANLIMAELHDPNSLILEVAYNSQRRVTLASETASIP
ncbi:hypothetical protein LC605_11780 [Nostoc sp. CHAB 5836]|uniref:hypothetical protein n=1 Tax=Nostoc sp. CHAB 5836 TaxID=2780404 RepID=UPI001E384D04|nr:hypothetical protein [Nostoc sp. CHAB 5836]MCC5615737.1 hypothetical protein [Nostoc sp. CHAB 5836]